MFGLGLPEIIVIILVVAVLFFGGGKIVDLARSLGRATGEFKKGKKEMEEELKEMTREDTNIKESSK
ncbi:MAG: twin-arginine translocase TatA/TatE family subunit [Patescibacteria group bacterium]